MKRISYIEDFEQWESGFSFYNSVKVRFGEVDMFGHVNNVVALPILKKHVSHCLKNLDLCKNGRMNLQKR